LVWLKNFFNLLKKIYTLIFLFLLSVINISCDSDEEIKFCESFLNHYEVGLERYTHEYHPFLLEKTTGSLRELEKRLKTEGFDINGRIVILGYEENAVPSYYTNFRQARIDDEAVVKNRRDWSVRLHNYFGIMTGFLFKDIGGLKCVDVPVGESLVEHINANTILIFDERASIFRRHAFGEALPLMQYAESILASHYSNGNFVSIWKDLISFWQQMYQHMIKVGNKQVAGTQDILFSMAYAKAIENSSLPVFKIFVGPDLTYPIEISCKQPKGATLNAQSFVKIFARKLVPIENKKTVYIFCSFVDGVGKSTNLGNLKNWMKYGDDVDKFTHVDNSSSQLAELFMFKDNVYIADLPAQMSHFTYKPDGLVYVEARTELSDSELFEVKSFVKDSQDTLTKDYYQACDYVKTKIDKEGFFAPEINNKNKPELWFIKNLILLKKDKELKWVPFDYKDNHWIVNINNLEELRVLRQLTDVKSEGLKNVESEQMLFDSGIIFPISYNLFLKDLITKLKERDITNIVFVDFLSMYPRSSRENIRINYLIQQLALLDKNFDVSESLYKDFISGGELLYFLLDKQMRCKINEALLNETLVRCALYNMITKQEWTTLFGVSLEKLTENLSNLLKKEKDLYGKQISLSVDKKICDETVTFEKIYGLSKSFVNIQLSSLSRIAALSYMLQQFFLQNIENESYRFLWADNDEPCNTLKDIKTLSLGKFNERVVVPIKNNTYLSLYYLIDKECKSEVYIAPLIRELRACWYALVLQLLGAQKLYNKHFVLNDKALLYAPLNVNLGQDGYIYVTQKYVDAFVGKLFLPVRSCLNLLSLIKCRKIRYGEYKEQPCLLDWSAKETTNGVYAYDCSLEKMKKVSTSYDASLITLFVQKYHADKGAGIVMPTYTLYEILSKSFLWKSFIKYLYQDAQYNTKQKILSQNSQNQDNIRDKKLGTIVVDNDSDDNVENKKNYYARREVVFGQKEQRTAAKIVVRLLATIEMVIKDPDEEIVVRYGNRDDFKAAIKLLEKVTLPLYGNLLFEKNLFKDYDRVEPYPSWEFWDNI